MWKPLLLTAFLVVSPSAFGQDRIHYVYRADTRPPQEVFEHGFSPRGQRLDVLAHTLGGSCDEAEPARASAWVSASAHEEEAVGFVEGRLGGMDAEGPETAMWVYEIRADSTYESVPALMDWVIRFGANTEYSYTPEHASTIRRLTRTTTIGTEHEVITYFVSRENIRRATPMWYQNGDLERGPPFENVHFLHRDTYANEEMPHNLNQLIPPASINTSNNSDSCSQSCDSASSSGPFELPQKSFNGSDYCRVRAKWLSPAVMRSLL